MQHQNIPLNQLVQSKQNVRRTNAKEGIEGLAASIEAQGLLQNLSVRPQGDKFEVIAGQRRLLALQSLSKAKKIAKDFPVPCSVIGEASDATAISLAENQMREAMHPDDQFEAFNALVLAGTPVEDVAAKFGVSPTVVRQRMKLAAVSPKLRAKFRDGELTLDQMMGFTVSDSHERQEEVWDTLKDSYEPDGNDIRRLLTEETVSADDGIAKFVGVKAYEKAGGVVIRDLFDDENEGYLADSLLLNSLAQAKLEQEAEKVKAEGWAWVKIELQRDYDPSYGRVYPIRDDQDEDFDEDEEVEETPDRYSEEDMARAGCIVSINHDGMYVLRGYVKPEDMPKSERRTSSGDKAKGEFSAPLIEELTAHKTAAIRAELVKQPGIALVCLAYSLALNAFYYGGGNAMQIHGNGRNLEDTSDKDECTAHAELEAAYAAWEKKLPKDEAKLFNWLLGQDEETIRDLTVFCAATTVDAVVSNRQSTAFNTSDLDHADVLAKTLGLDMAKYWSPTADGFISKMKKGEMVRALNEAGMSGEATKVTKLAKAAAITTTARALDGMRWLPKTLQVVGQ